MEVYVSAEKVMIVKEQRRDEQNNKEMEHEINTLKRNNVRILRKHNHGR